MNTGMIDLVFETAMYDRERQREIDGDGETDRQTFVHLFRSYKRPFSAHAGYAT